MLLIAFFGVDEEFWKYCNDNPEFAKCFNDDMTAMTNIQSIALRKYEGFKDMKTLVDVGGGLGKTLETIISTYAQIHGITYDLPCIISNLPTMHAW
jgi:caffeic acid 3-O-methyltransferase